MAPKPRAVKKNTTNPSSVPDPASMAPKRATTQPSSTPTSTRKTRGALAAAATSLHTVAPSTQGVEVVNPLGQVPPKPVPSAGTTGKSLAKTGEGGQQHRSNSSASQKAAATKARKRSASKADADHAQAPKKKQKAMTTAAIANEMLADEEAVSSDDELALALALARRRGGKKAHRSAAADTKEQRTAAASDVEPGSEDEGAVQTGEGDPSEDSAGEEQGEDDVDESSSDGLLSDDDGLAAQLAVERPVWAKKTVAKKRAPPTYADIGAPRSEKARRLCDRPIENSPGGSVSEAEAENSEEEKFVTDDEAERQWLKTLQQRAARAKKNKALPPLLPPTVTDNKNEKPTWKASKKHSVAAATPKTLVLSAHKQVIDVDSDEPGATDDPEVQDNDHAAAPSGDGPDVQLPSAYTIIRPDHGVVNLTAQHVHIRKAVRDVLPRLEAKLAFENAFPDTITLSRDVNDSLINVARENGNTGLEQALRVNAQLSSALAAIVKQRMSTYRGNLKKLADTHVTAYYQLKPGCGAYASLLFDHLTYCYVHNYDSVNARVQVSWNKPYGHDVFPAMLQAAFFNGGSSLAARNAELFTSTLDARPDEKEIPIPMLAFVGTAIHASLTEWHTGTHTHVSFSADAFLDVYNEHKLLLSGIKAGNARGFHAMMHRLYRDASGTTPTNSDAAVAAANSALAQVDFANMLVD